MNVYFTAEDPNTKALTTFNITSLTEYCKTDLAPVLVPLTVENAVQIVQQRGLEQHRFDRLTVEMCAEPLIFAHMPDDTWLLIDGNHRYVKMVLQYYSKIAIAYLVEKEVWDKHLVKTELTMDQVMANPSGL